MGRAKAAEAGKAVRARDWVGGKLVERYGAR